MVNIVAPALRVHPLLPPAQRREAERERERERESTDTSYRPLEKMAQQSGWVITGTYPTGSAGG